MMNRMNASRVQRLTDAMRDARAVASTILIPVYIHEPVENMFLVNCKPIHNGLRALIAVTPEEQVKFFVPSRGLYVNLSMKTEDIYDG